MNKIYVKPKEGITVKDRLGRVINPEGQMVCDDYYIRRLLRTGDLEIKTKPVKKPEKKKE